MHANNSKRRPGNVAVATALSLVTLMSCVALAVDGGMMQDRRRHTQAAADAAALAAASRFYYNWTRFKGSDADGAALAAAHATASANGYTDGENGVTVTVHIPPTTGPSAGMKGVAEVVIQYDHDRYFSKVFGGDKVPIRSRAVAHGKSTPARSGTLGPRPDQEGGTEFGRRRDHDRYRVADPGQLQQLRGGHLQRQRVHHRRRRWGVGHHRRLRHPRRRVHRRSGQDQPGADRRPPGATSIPPDPGKMPVRSTKKLNIKKDRTLQPGVYVGGININDCVVTMKPGIYYMLGGGFSWSGGGTLTGDGVMVYADTLNGGDTISLSGNAGVACNLSPPTDGPYKGILFWQRRDSVSPINITGNGAMNISGTFYAVSGDMKVTGNGDSDLMGSQYIVNTMTTGGTGNFSVSWTPETVPPTRMVALIE